MESFFGGVSGSGGLQSLGQLHIGCVDPKNRCAHKIYNTNRMTDEERNELKRLLGNVKPIIDNPNIPIETKKVLITAKCKEKYPDKPELVGKYVKCCNDLLKGKYEKLLFDKDGDPQTMGFGIGNTGFINNMGRKKKNSNKYLLCPEPQGHLGDCEMRFREPPSGLVSIMQNDPDPIKYAECVKQRCKSAGFHKALDRYQTCVAKEAGTARFPRVPCPEICPVISTPDPMPEPPVDPVPEEPPVDPVPEEPVDPEEEEIPVDPEDPGTAGSVTTVTEESQTSEGGISTQWIIIIAVIALIVIAGLGVGAYFLFRGKSSPQQYGPRQYGPQQYGPQQYGPQQQYAEQQWQR
jgi:hypothetical protein